MIQQDKFGNSIYYSKFKILLETSKKLIKLNYQESYKKQNLFSKKVEGGMFYADMRGTEEVPIWGDTDPLFYWFFDEQTPFWKQRRLIEQEINSFHKNKCPFRLSFEAHHDSVFSLENYEHGNFTSFEEGIFDWENGFCQKCGKDFQDNGKLCKECKNTK